MVFCCSSNHVGRLFLFTEDNSLAKGAQISMQHCFFVFYRKLLCHQETTSPYLLSLSVFILQWPQLRQMCGASLRQPGSGPDSTGMDNNKGVRVNQLASPGLGILHWAELSATWLLGAMWCSLSPCELQSLQGRWILQISCWAPQPFFLFQP